MNRLRTGAVVLAACAALALVAAPALGQAPGGDTTTSTTTSAPQPRDLTDDEVRDFYRYHDRRGRMGPGVGPMHDRIEDHWDSREFGPMDRRSGRDFGRGLFGALAIGGGILLGALILLAGGGVAGYFLGRSQGRKQPPAPSGPGPHGAPVPPGPPAPPAEEGPPVTVEGAGAVPAQSPERAPDAPTEESPPA